MKNKKDLIIIFMIIFSVVFLGTCQYGVIQLQDKIGNSELSHVPPDKLGKVLTGVDMRDSTEVRGHWYIHFNGDKRRVYHSFNCHCKEGERENETDNE